MYSQQQEQRATAIKEILLPQEYNRNLPYEVSLEMPRRENSGIDGVIETQNPNGRNNITLPSFENGDIDNQSEIFKNESEVITVLASRIIGVGFLTMPINLSWQSYVFISILIIVNYFLAKFSCEYTSELRDKYPSNFLQLIIIKLTHRSFAWIFTLIYLSFYFLFPSYHFLAINDLYQKIFNITDNEQMKIWQFISYMLLGIIFQLQLSLKVLVRSSQAAITFAIIFLGSLLWFSSQEIWLYIREHKQQTLYIQNPDFKTWLENEFSIILHFAPTISIMFQFELYFIPIQSWLEEQDQGKNKIGVPAARSSLNLGLLYYFLIIISIIILGNFNVDTNCGKSYCTLSDAVQKYYIKYCPPYLQWILLMTILLKHLVQGYITLHIAYESLCILYDLTWPTPTLIKKIQGSKLESRLKEYYWKAPIEINNSMRVLLIIVLIGFNYAFHFCWLDCMKFIFHWSGIALAPLLVFIFPGFLFIVKGCKYKEIGQKWKNLLIFCLLGVFIIAINAYSYCNSNEK